jgi:hypothetical protein
MRDIWVENRGEERAVEEMGYFDKKNKGEKGTCMYIWKVTQKCIYKCIVRMH